VTGVLAAIGVLLLLLLIVLAAASFFAHVLAAVVTLSAIPVVALLFPLIGADGTVFLLATLAILVCVIHTITDTFRLARAPGPGTASSARRSS
jgi:hypothetical protein